MAGLREVGLVVGGHLRRERAEADIGIKASIGRLDRHAADAVRHIRREQPMRDFAVALADGPVGAGERDDLEPWVVREQAAEALPARAGRPEGCHLALPTTI